MATPAGINVPNLYLGNLATTETVSLGVDDALLIDNTTTPSTVTFDATLNLPAVVAPFAVKVAGVNDLAINAAGAVAFTPPVNQGFAVTTTGTGTIANTVASTGSITNTGTLVNNALTQYTNETLTIPNDTVTNVALTNFTATAGALGVILQCTAGGAVGASLIAYITKTNPAVVATATATAASSYNVLHSPGGAATSLQVNWLAAGGPTVNHATNAPGSASTVLVRYIYATAY